MLLRPEYLEQLRPFIGTNIVKVLVGVRRSGKSTILRMMQEELRASGVPDRNILTLNFESADFMDVSDARALVSWVRAQAPKTGRVHIFLNEIQEVVGWEVAVRSFLVDYDADIYVTGSNAHLLSSDLATHITGRYVTVHVYPLSFAEFHRGLTQFADEGGDVPTEPYQAFAMYLVQGGFPFQLELGYRKEPTLKYLQDLFATILLRDVVKHAAIRDVDQLQRIVRYAIAEEGHLLTPKRIADFLKSERRTTRQETVANYLGASEDAFLLYRAGREDVVGKKRLQFNEKFYVVDQGLRQAIGLDNRANIDQVLEGVVYMELLRRRYEVTVGRVGDREIDFVARRDGSTSYFQVTYLLATSEVREREFGALAAVPDNYPKFVLSMDPLPAGQDGIEALNVIDWLLLLEG